MPSPVESTKNMKGKGCAGVWVTGRKDGKQRSVYLYQIADCEECMEKYGTNSVVAQTALGPAIMLDLIANGIWNTPGVNSPEAFDPDEFVKRMDLYGFPPGLQERPSEYSAKLDNDAMLAALSK